jgi:triphosphoribosyl-dephospho-CoA synthase
MGNYRSGKFILEAVTETERWVANNTNLGIVMLLTPICAAAVQMRILMIQRIIHKDESTTPHDAVHL